MKYRRLSDGTVFTKDADKSNSYYVTLIGPSGEERCVSVRVLEKLYVAVIE